MSSITNYAPSSKFSRSSGRSYTFSLSSTDDTNYDSTSSLKYDTSKGFKSTQQLNTDFSKFENHTFFASAEAKVNVAFDKIINRYPFDGTKKELENFFDGLTGFEKWVYDSFPKNVGYLMFSGASGGTALGTSIVVKDVAGSTFVSLSQNDTGEKLLDPAGESFTIEFHIHVPTIANADQTICQKRLDSTHGISIGLKQTVSTTNCEIFFGIKNGSDELFVSKSISKGTFHHIACVYDRTNDKLSLYTDLSVATETTSAVDFDDIDTEDADFILGSGSDIQYTAYAFDPTETFSGSLDEFRFFHSTKSLTTLTSFAKKSIFATDDLMLYFKFNEPTGTIGQTSSDELNEIVIDSSGKSFHSKIQNFDFSMRSTGSIDVPMTYEKLNLSPVLFPAFTDVIELNANLLVSASEYDDANPNLITRLIPEHYVLDSQRSNGLETFNGNLGNAYPIDGNLTISHSLLTALYVWATFFDEIKMSIDAFSTLRYVNYDDYDTVPDAFLLDFAKYWGIQVPMFFNESNISQFVDAENVLDTVSTSQYSLRYVQNKLLRRILSATKEIIKSKGTLHSVKAFLRSIGIDPDKSLRIREYGGPTKKTLKFAREDKSVLIPMLNFSASNQQIKGAYLSGSRVEVGWPYAAPFVNVANYPPHGISSTARDGLLTSGSWTYEGYYRYSTNTIFTDLNQSLVKLCTTGSATETLQDGGILFNLVYQTENDDIGLYGRPGSGATINDSPLLEMHLTGVNIVDGNGWYVSFGKIRADEFNEMSSSYYLRAARQSNGKLIERHETNKLFVESITPSNNILSYKSTTYNPSGTFLLIGSSSHNVGAYRLLNDSTNVTSSLARSIYFDGQVANIRFWSKSLNTNEWFEHVKNPLSFGVEDPRSNFNFSETVTGSFSRLRVDVTMNQDATSSSGNNLKLFDYSQNGYHFSGSNFFSDATNFYSYVTFINTRSPNFDESLTSEKVRVRSFLTQSNIDESLFAVNAPLYSIPKNEAPIDDARFSIEFSIIDALNEDIIKMFGTLDSLDNALGDPRNLYAMYYRSLEEMRDIYFNRLTDKMNFKVFFEFFKWFDQSIGGALEQLIPKKTRYLGTNYVVKSHVLERNKLQYQTDRSDFSQNIRVKLPINANAIRGAADGFSSIRSKFRKGRI